MDALKKLTTLDLNGSGKNVADIAARHVRSLISRGAFPPGARLPSGRQLAKAWGISYVNTQHALAECARQGFLHRRRNAGTVVAEHAGVQRMVRRVHVLIQETEQEARTTDYSRSTYFAPLLAGIQEELGAREIMAISSMIGSPSQEKLFLDSLHDHPIDAVLLFRSQNTAIIEALNQRSIPLLLVDPHVPNQHQPTLLQDCRRGGNDVANWLIHKGKISPALMVADDGKWITHEWNAAFHATLDNYFPGCDIERGGRFHRGDPKERMIDHLTRLLRSEQRPDALVMNLISPDIPRAACEKAGIRPEDLCLVGYSRERGAYRPGADLWLNNMQYGRRVARITYSLIYARNEPPALGARYYIPLELVDDEGSRPSLLP